MRTSKSAESIRRFAVMNRMRLNNRIPRGSFVHNVLMLMSGTFVAQIIPIAASPILTRLYSPEEFGLFAVFSSLAALVTIVSTGRYELAILLPEDDKEAANIAALALTLLAMAVVLSFIALTVFNRPIAYVLGNPKVSPWLLVLPLSVFFAACYEILYYWTNRKERFARLAVTKVTISSATIGANLIMGVSRFGAGGLVLGGLAGQGVATGILAGQTWRADREVFRRISWRKMRALAHRFRKFPIFSLPADSCNSLANQVPFVIFSGFYSATIAGQFLLTQRIMGVPLSLIAKSIQDVFKQKASSDFARNGNCRAVFLKTLKSLVLLAFVPLVGFLLFAPSVFIFVFGQEWREAGIFAQLLSIMFFFRFIASPLSYVIYIAEKQNYDLIWQIGLLFLTLASLLGGVALGEPRLSVVFYSIAYSIMYIIYFFISYRFASGRDKLFGPVRRLPKE